MSRSYHRGARSARRRFCSAWTRMEENSNELLWPGLNYGDWKETYRTLHRWTQIVGKIRLSKSPWINHSWSATFYVSADGLTTGLIHDQDHEKTRSFSIEFDFIRHLLRISCSDGKKKEIPLVSESVASFYGRCSGLLHEIDIEFEINEHPNELIDSIPFSEDQVHCHYEPEYAHRFWRILLQADRVMKNFRSLFIGKSSPVQFFWGSFDLAVTRFSGRRAPEHPGGVPHLPDLVTREAYSHEESSCGFWPGNDLVPYPAFYSYVYPEPKGFSSTRVNVSGAFYDPKLREFLLPYDRVRLASNPDEMVLKFFQSTYDAAADLGSWDRRALEESPFLDQIRALRTGKAA